MAAVPLVFTSDIARDGGLSTVFADIQDWGDIWQALFAAGPDILACTELLPASLCTGFSVQGLQKSTRAPSETSVQVQIWVDVAKKLQNHPYWRCELESFRRYGVGSQMFWVNMHLYRGAKKGASDLVVLRVSQHALQ